MMLPRVSPRVEPMFGVIDVTVGCNPVGCGLGWEMDDGADGADKECPSLQPASPRESNGRTIPIRVLFFKKVFPPINVARTGSKNMNGSKTRHALAELLGKRDNDALRPADVG